jgi:hypothetical protein
MAETLTTTIQSILDSFKLGNIGFVNEVVSAIRSEKVDQNSRTLLDDIGILLSDSTYLKERFSANEVRKKQGLVPLPLSEILELENSYTATLQAAGLPAGFYDDPATDFQGFIARRTSPAEIKRRVDEGYTAVRNADPEVIKQFKELYGVTEGELAAYFLDPTRQQESITKSMESASIAAEGRLAAGIQLGVGQAEELQQAGVTSATARKGFADIAAQQEVFNPLQGEEAITQAEQIGGTFGTNTAAAQRIAKRRRQRTAEFETGGGFARTNQFATEGLRTVGQ